MSEETKVHDQSVTIKKKTKKENTSFVVTPLNPMLHLQTSQKQMSCTVTCVQVVGGGGGKMGESPSPPKSQTVFP